MKSENMKDNLLNEHLRKIKHHVDYKINESPKYRPLVSGGEQYDEIPSLTNEAGAQEDAPLAQEKEPVAPSNDQPIGMGGGEDAPIPAFAQTGDTEAGGVDPTISTDPMGMGAGIQAPPPVDNIQNDIIKHNIEAMKSIHTQLEDLNNIISGLNKKMDILNSDVEEVREPTNSEKLINKKQVSYPYYFNLNDFWGGNWFDTKRKEENDGGIRELPDGSYIADFDDLPQSSKIDIQNSFGEIYESAGKKKSK